MGILAKKVSKLIGRPPAAILREIDLEIQEGDFLALTGRSGSGKSSLLYLLSSLDLASEGAIEIDKQNVAKMSAEDLCAFRNAKMGFVFQFHYLLSELNALENVLFPARKNKLWEKKKKYAQELLSWFGLKDKLLRFPCQ
ncbi:MAG: ATP-binding cassette domain-containing protein, partial [Parachlamydiales bacterium]